MKSKIPQFAASTSTIHAIQCAVMMVSFVCTIALTQKLWDANIIGIVRYGTHVSVQVIGASIILYLMLSPEVAISAYR